MSGTWLAEGNSEADPHAIPQRRAKLVIKGTQSRALRIATTDSQNESTSLHCTRRVANRRNFNLINS
jgi:hypothetical protein